MIFSEAEFLPLSALQHLAFCPRRCALIHIEQEWQENVLTARGRLEHDRVHSGYREYRQGRKQISGIHVQSRNLGIYGQLDILELDLKDIHGSDNLTGFKLKGNWRIYPVEFKHGKPKKNDSYRVQLCAQVLCLEEMLNVTIEEAALFYYSIRKREQVSIDAQLRQKTIDLAKELHQLFDSGVTPPPVYNKRCNSCSLVEVCYPKKLSKNNRYWQILFSAQEAE